MQTNSNYTFEVSLSTQAFDHKPNKVLEVPDLCFNKKTVDVTSFMDSIIDGYCYTGVYSSDYFDMDARDKEHYQYTYLVSIDVDHSQETMTEMVDRLEYKPTCSYTSTRDGLNGESRFRLVYCFENKVEGGEEYKNLVYAIFYANKLDFDEEVNGQRKYDSQTDSAYQLYFGNGTSTFDCTISDIIYNIDDFKDYYKDNNDNIDNKKSVIKNYIYSTPHPNIHLNETFTDKQFESDFWNLDMQNILAKYLYVYPNLERTPLETPDDDTPVIMLPENYVKINRVCKVGKTGKYVKVNAGTPIKIKDGQGRRRALFWNGILRRLINPEISFDNLVYNLLFELCYYITNYNAENIIGKRDIYQIAKSVMKQDMTKYQYLTGADKEYIANNDYCIKHNVTGNQARQFHRGRVTAARIGELYDCSLSDKENLKLMEESGLDIKQSTLYRWKKANGLVRAYKKNDSKAR